MTKYREMLKQRRKARKVRQNDFAALGIGQAQYSRLERGGDAMLSTLERVALMLGLEIRLIPREKVAQVDLLITSQEKQEIVKKQPNNVKK